MNYKIRLWMSCVLFCVTIIVDRITKAWAFTLIAPLYVNEYVSYECVINRGISWSMLYSDNTIVFSFVSLLIAVVVIFFALYTYQRYQDRKDIMGASLVLAGAISNLIDRVWYGGVIDFICVQYGSWIWPIFNIADIAICCGMFCMLFIYKDMI